MKMKFKQKFEYNYRLIKTSWGISISFCGVLYDEKAICNYESVNNKIKYIVSNKISDKEKELLIKGIYLFCNYTEDSSFFTKQIIYFDHVNYSLCDYQDDGLIVGTVECLSYLFGVKSLIINVSFDKEKNKYCYYLKGNILF